MQIERGVTRWTSGRSWHRSIRCAPTLWSAAMSECSLCPRSRRCAVPRRWARPSQARPSEGRGGGRRRPGDSGICRIGLQIEGAAIHFRSRTRPQGAPRTGGAPALPGGTVHGTESDFPGAFAGLYREVL